MARHALLAVLAMPAMLMGVTPVGASAQLSRVIESADLRRTVRRLSPSAVLLKRARAAAPVAIAETASTVLRPGEMILAVDSTFKPTPSPGSETRQDLGVSGIAWSNGSPVRFHVVVEPGTPLRYSARAGRVVGSVSLGLENDDHSPAGRVLADSVVLQLFGADE
ncbi:MAG TPA: hypothetical protein VFV33_10425, partial [Gemmatimonadaceae bacterium]|nr:hypothetical protein [Gemmatimonadaceae bacterium]